MGFEPTGASFARPNRLAGDPFRPLRHLPKERTSGGEGGIRTPEAHRLAVFKTAAFNHSATSPRTTLWRDKQTLEREARSHSIAALPDTSPGQ